MRRDQFAIAAAFCAEILVLALVGTALRSQWTWADARVRARDLSLLESRGTEHVLRARYGVDQSYDALAADLARERVDVSALSDLARIAGNDVAISSAVAASQSYYLQRDQAVEEFKSANAVVRNARSHIPVLIDSTSAESATEVYEAARALEHALYVHDLGPNDVTRAGVDSTAAALAAAARTRGDAKAELLAREAQAYVARADVLDSSLNAVLAMQAATSPYEALGDEIQAKVDAATVRTGRGFVALALSSAALICGMFLMTRRLARSERQLQDAVRDLETRAREIARQKDLVAALNSDLEARVEIRTRELAEANRQLAASNKSKTEFLANMSHEIRTPLSAVQGFAELMLDPDLPASDRLSHVMTIRRNGEHLLGVINDILDLSKIEAGRMTLERVPAHPAKLLVDVASLMRVRAVEKGIDFEVVFATAIPERVMGDPTRIRQILLNLTGNAIKFTTSGRVTIEAGLRDADQKVLWFSVRDTGIGLTQEEIGRLFQPFSQADTSTTRRYGGTGLGLSICHRLANAMQGTIAVESEPGKGSCFTFEFPVGTLDGVPLLGQLSEALTPPGTPREHSAERIALAARILLADDGRDNQLLISTHLRKAGAEVVVVENGALAVDAALDAQAAGRPFDLVLMDMQMPVLDGYAATTKLRARGYGGPVVALTAHAMAGDRERCLKAGCDDYMTKPIDRAVLLASVARWASSRPDPAAAQHLSLQPRGASDASLRSTYADDPDMADIVVEFVDSLPEHMAAMDRALCMADRDELKRLAHQMKGAGGGYGFMPLTHAAGALEKAVSEGAGPEELARHTRHLAELCASAEKPQLGRVA